MSWNTKLTRAFPCRVPIVGAPMAGVAGGVMAAEVCRAGGLGFIAAGYFQPNNNNDNNNWSTTAEEQIQLFYQARKDANYPLCVGFIGHAALNSPQGWDRFQKLLEQHRPAVVQFFAPSILQHPDDANITNVTLAKDYGAKFVAQVGNVAEAELALAANVDAIIAQGSEAGGHGLRRSVGNGTLPLVSQIASMAPNDMPVIAAGGIVNGRGLAAALAICDGAVLGTRLWASKESIGKPSLQNELILPTTNCDNVVRTTVFDWIENELIATPWPEPYDSVGALRNQTSDAWDGRPEDELKGECRDTEKPFLSDYQKALKEGNPAIAKVLAGEGVGEITSIEHAYDIVLRTEKEAKAALQRMIAMVPVDGKVE